MKGRGVTDLFEAEHVFLEELNICNSFHFPLPFLFFSIHIGTVVAFT
jgi:hypothetical protein